MRDERLFQVTGDGAIPAIPIDLAAAGFKERQDLQEWVLEYPEILGEDVLVITHEFGSWNLPTGKQAQNRFDVLGLDSDGRLVLAELKRDTAPKDVHLQAITYAALVSTFTPEDIISLLHQRLRKTKPNATLEDSEAEITSHCEALDEDLLRSPRIVLVAGDFDPVTMTTIDWLVSQGLDISLQRVQAYRTESKETVITVSRIYPIPALDEFKVTPGRAKAKAKTAQRAITTVSRLVDSGVIPDGTELYLEPDNSVGPEYRQSVRDWLKEHPNAGIAHWQNSVSSPLIWQRDGEAYSPTAIAQTVLLEATGLERSLAGPRWWRDWNGRTLPRIAGIVSSGSFDWEPLHRVLSQLPKGRWTLHDELADLVETGVQLVAGHVAACTECENAWRVLGASGKPSSGFRWTDEERTDTQQEALEAEGILFLPGGQADPSARLTTDELSELLASAE